MKYIVYVKLSQTTIKLLLSAQDLCQQKIIVIVNVYTQKNTAIIVIILCNHCYHNIINKLKLLPKAPQQR